jgi:adenosine/AMP kinase
MRSGHHGDSRVSRARRWLLGSVPVKLRLEAVIAETEPGTRYFLGVIHGGKSKAIEGAEGIAWRKDLLRKIGYKL